MTAKNSNFALSRSDVLKLISEKTIETKTEVINKITRGYDNGDFSSNELQLANDILRTLARDAESAVRKTIADNLKRSPDLPHDVAVKLASDVEEVSIPVLEASMILNDDDLIEIIKSSNNTNKHLAITKRSIISGIVSESLVSTNNKEVVESLLGNDGATIFDRSYEDILSLFANDKDISDFFYKRQYVPAYIKEKLMAEASDNLKEYLISRYNIDAESVTNIVSRSYEYITLKTLGFNPTHLEIDNMVNHLYENNKLTINIIITAICTNHLPFVEAAFAKIANIPVSNARTLLKDTKGLGFESLYRKVNFPERLIDAVSILLFNAYEIAGDNNAPLDQEFCNRLIEQVIEDNSLESVDGLPYILNLINNTVITTHQDKA